MRLIHEFNICFHARERFPSGLCGRRPAGDTTKSIGFFIHDTTLCSPKLFSPEVSTRYFIRQIDTRLFGCLTIDLFLLLYFLQPTLPLLNLSGRQVRVRMVFEHRLYISKIVDLTRLRPQRLRPLIEARKTVSCWMHCLRQMNGVAVLLRIILRT